MATQPNILYVHSGDTLTEADRNEISKIHTLANIDVKKKSEVTGIENYDGFAGDLPDSLKNKMSATEAIDTFVEPTFTPAPTPAEPVAPVHTKFAAPEPDTETSA